MTRSGSDLRLTVALNAYETVAMEGVQADQQLSSKSAAVGWALRLAWRILSKLAQHREHGENAQLEWVVTTPDGKTRRETIWII